MIQPGWVAFGLRRSAYLPPTNSPITALGLQMRTTMTGLCGGAGHPDSSPHSHIAGSFLAELSSHPTPNTHIVLMPVTISKSVFGDTVSPLGSFAVFVCFSHLLCASYLSIDVDDLQRPIPPGISLPTPQVCSIGSEVHLGNIVTGRRRAPAQFP